MPATAAATTGTTTSAFQISSLCDYHKLGCSGMFTILVKTIVNTNNNVLAKSTADTNTNSAFKKVNRMIVVEKMAKSLYTMSGKKGASLFLPLTPQNAN